MNVSTDILNDGARDTVVNVRVETFQVIEKLLIYGKLCLREHEHDERYQKVLVRTVTDVEMLTKGFYGNFVTKTIMENLLPSIDFELKLPFPKRVYKVTNFTMADTYFSRIVTTKFLIVIRFVGSVQGNSKSFFISLAQIFCEIKH